MHQNPASPLQSLLDELARPRKLRQQVLVLGIVDLHAAVGVFLPDGRRLPVRVETQDGHDVGDPGGS